MITKTPLLPRDNENLSGTPNSRREETVRRLKEGAKVYDVVEQPRQPGNARSWVPCPEVETWQIEDALRETGGQLKEAARKLGISRVSLWRRMKAEPALRDFKDEI